MRLNTTFGFNGILLKQSFVWFSFFLKHGKSSRSPGQTEQNGMVILHVVILKKVE